MKPPRRRHRWLRRRRRHHTNDISIEKLGESLKENPRGLLVFRDAYLSSAIAALRNQAPHHTGAPPAPGPHSSHQRSEQLGRGLCQSVAGSPPSILDPAGLPGGHQIEVVGELLNGSAQGLPHYIEADGLSQLNLKASLRKGLE